MDVDLFKAYNDAFGHPAGDQVLRQVAQLLLQTARASDFVARYGGEEFVVVLPNTDSTGATVMAERFRAAIQSAEWPNRAITASFGVSSLSVRTQTHAQLVMEADFALYASKKNGRNRSTHYWHLAPTEDAATPF
jgi:diguanylate cyclase (GGDEF)-like protein